MTKPLTIAVIAGEVSGDQLGGWLMEAIRAKRPDVKFIGLGGPQMQGQGLESLFPIKDIALIGIAEILPHALTILKRIRQMVLFLEREQPDMVITIDVPGFSLRVLKKLRARANIRPAYVHYVAPTVWAYRPERAKDVAQRYDHLLCLLPFEPPYFEAENLPASFIGHEIAWWWKKRGDAEAFRRYYQLSADGPLLAVFPGSRRGEIARLWPVFREAIRLLRQDIPSLQVAIQVPDALLNVMEEHVQRAEIPALVLSNRADKKNLFAAATAALAKSGTIGLECALAGLPGIISYRANAISVFLLRRMITVPYVHLANILAGKMVVPELLQEDATPEKLAAALKPLLTDASAREAQRTELGRIAAMLGADETRSPSEKAADILLAMI